MILSVIHSDQIVTARPQGVLLYLRGAKHPLRTFDCGCIRRYRRRILISTSRLQWSANEFLLVDLCRQFCRSAFKEMGAALATRSKRDATTVP